MTEIFMDAIDTIPTGANKTPINTLKRSHVSIANDTNIEPSDTDSPDAKQTRGAIYDFIKSINSTNEQVHKFLKEDSDSIDPGMKLLLTLMVNQASTSAILLEKLETPQPAYGQPPSYANWENAFTEHRHRRSVVVSDLPESDLSLPSQRLAADENQVKEILDLCKIECKPFSIFRMGRKVEGRSRLLKIEFPSKSVSGKLLRNKKSLKAVNKFSKVFIRPSMPREDRDKRKLLQQECNEKNNQNPTTEPSQKFVIYANRVVRRCDIP